MFAPRLLWRMGRILVAYKQRKETVKPLPLRLWVESTTLCNLECVMCPNKDLPSSAKSTMSLETFHKIVDEARHFANDIYLHHRGEPFINPNLCEMITYARAAGLRTRFHTNGAVMTHERADALLEAAPNLISFSVDGFEKESYEAVRVGATFEETVEQICYLAEQKRKRGQQRPYIVVEKINFRNPTKPEHPATVAALRQRFLEAGVNEVIDKEEYVWAEEDAPEENIERTSSYCTFPWYAMVICADGTVTPCPQDFWAKMVMGNVKDKSLAEIWNDAPYRKLRGSFGDKIDSLSLCRKCDRLCRKTVGGVPLQYVATFLIDQFVGYGPLRRLFGTSERNG